MAPSNAELEQYRNPDEGLDQWRVKKAFLEKNWEEFPEDRRQQLVTLMHCFHNMHVWGCSYPPKVMAEVKRLSDGLMTKKPREKRKPDFVKINFVAATPVSNPFMVLDDDCDGMSVEAPSEEIDPEKPPRGKRKQKKKRNAVKSESQRKQPVGHIEVDEPTTQKEPVDDDDDLLIPRCGLGFKSSATTPRALRTDAPQSNFVFGKTHEYIKKLGFVRSSEVNEGFEFGKPILVSHKPAPETGFFTFGVDKMSTNQTSTEEFSFGNLRKDIVNRSSDDLQQRFENASLLDRDVRSKKKSLDAEGVIATEHSEVLGSLETVRTALRKIRPPLAQSRIEFLMLQVNLTTQGKVKVNRKGRKINLVYDGVVVASGSNENAAYEDLRVKIIDARPWCILSNGPQLTLELGMPSESPSPAKRKPSIPTMDPSASSLAGFSDARMPTQNQTSLFSGSGRSDSPKLSSDANCLARNPKGNANSTNAQSSRPLTKAAKFEILRNLETVRKIVRSPMFNSKIEMLGGSDKHPMSALNVAFQMAVLKPVRDAEVVTPSCKIHTSRLPTNLCKCILRVHGVIVSESSAGSLRDAKKLASRNLLAALRSNQSLRISFNGGENRLQASVDPSAQEPTNAQPACVRNSVPKTSELGDFFLIKTADASPDLCSILNRSSHANELNSPVYAWSRDGADEVCRVTLSEKHSLEFEGRGRTKAEAKNEAVRTTLSTLIASCPTIVVSSISADAQEFVKETMPLGTGSHSVTEGLNRKITDENVGFRILEKMGWTGGGLGAGSGLIEPITLRDNSGNSGLGYTKPEGPSKLFTKNINSTLRAFLRETNVFEELKFSPTFSNEERKHIHSIARRLGLKSKSSDQPEGRVLCISHNIDWKMVLESLREQGGTLGKFSLLPPGSWSIPDPESSCL